MQKRTKYGLTVWGVVFRVFSFLMLNLLLLFVFT